MNTGLAPIAEFIAGSVPAMLGGVALFASTISRQLAPSLFNAASGAAAAAKGVQEMAAAKLQDLRITKGFPKGYKAFNDSVIEGTASLEEMDEKQKKLTRSIATHQRHVDKYEGTIPTPEGDKERIGISNEQDLIKKNASEDDIEKYKEKEDDEEETTESETLEDRHSGLKTFQKVKEDSLKLKNL